MVAIILVSFRSIKYTVSLALAEFTYSILL